MRSEPERYMLIMMLRCNHMDNNCKVSVIMPVYKSEPYIEEAIQSVINQTHQNIELLCINDSTPDGAFDICKRYQKEYPWIKLIENSKNQGQEFTRNRGLDEMTGDYVLFLDSDDTIAPDMLEKMVDAAQREDADVVLSAYSMVVDSKDIPVVVDNAASLEQTMDISAFSNALLAPIEWDILSCVGSKLYKTSVIQNSHLRFDRQYKYNEDGAFILSFLRICQRVSFINEPFYKYRIRNAGSVMSSYQPEMFQSLVRVNELLRDLFIQTNVFDRKKEEYYSHLFVIIIASLRNEAKFGDIKSFYAVLREIQSYTEYGSIWPVLKQSSALRSKKKAALLLLRMRLYRILYYLLKKQNRYTL